MKHIRVIISLMLVVALLSASAFSAGAIGFEAEEAYASVFVIYSGNSLGSGFAIGSNCIVTNAHVISSGRSITVETYSGEKYTASVVGLNQQEDIAVLAVADAEFPYLPIADLSTMKTGDDIYAIGAPKGMAYTLTKGGISAKERTVGTQTYIQIDAPINEGNSGGPLLNDAGQVLGMNTLKMSDSEGIGLAIPIDRVCEYIRSLDIALDDGGNVTGNLEVPEDTQITPTRSPEHNEENNTDEQKKSETPVVLYVMCVIALMLLGGNILFAALWISQKKRNALLQTDPSERTDFEIEILE